MKRPQVFLLALVAILSFGFAKGPSNAELGKAKITISYSFANIEEGYDHQTKTEIYVDGVLVGTSTIKKESEPNSITVKTKKGMHNIEIVNYAFYENAWEKHTIENQYSQDFIYKADMNFKKSNSLKLVFDIDEGVKVIE